MNKKRNKRRKGTVLILSMFLLSVILLMAGIFLEMTILNMMHITKSIDFERASWIARAGISRQIHDMREYWYLHQQEVREEEFGGGAYKIGSATLIGRGFHKALIVSVGRYPLESDSIDETKIKSVCEAAEISMNTPTDYLLYTVPKGGAMPLSGVEFSGPIYVDGDIKINRHWEQAFFLKNENDYGPVLSASQYIYYGTQGGGGKVFYGEGSASSTGTITCSSKKYIYDGTTNIWKQGGHFDYEKFRADVDVEKVNTATGEKFGYRLIEDKENGSVKFQSILKTSDITYEKYKNLIDEESWHITSADTKGWPKVKRANENFNLPASYHGVDVRTKEAGQVPLGVVPFGPGNFTINGPSDRVGISHMKYVKFLYFQDKSGIAWDTSLLETTTKDLYAVGVGHKGGPDGMNCYTIDRAAGTFTVKYPFIWHSFRFHNPPGNPTAGRIRGIRRKSEDKLNTGGLNVVLSIQHAPIITDPDFSPKVKVFVSPGATYNDATAVEWTETTTLTNKAAVDNMFVPDYAAGTLTFGDDAARKCHTVSFFREDRSLSGFLDFDPNEFYAYTEAAQECVEINLDRITEDNSPRDPKYPDEPKKRGIIFSEMPLIIWGAPSVPVTIVCTDDVYVGPINSSYINPNNIDNHLDIVNKSLDLNDANAQPVGILAKKFMWYDHTLAPFIPGVSGYKVNLNSWTTKEVIKKWVANKVALYSGFMYDKVSTSNYYGSQFANHEVGVAGKLHEIGFGAGKSKYWDGEYDYMYPARYIIGSLYRDNESGAPATVAAKAVNLKYGGNDASDHIYASSFRTNPPPHMPMYVTLTNWTRIAQEGDPYIDADGVEVKKLRGENFIDELAAQLGNLGSSDGNVEYTPGFAKILSEMLTILEGGEIVTEEE